MSLLFVEMADYRCVLYMPCIKNLVSWIFQYTLPCLLLIILWDNKKSCYALQDTEFVSFIREEFCGQASTV